MTEVINVWRGTNKTINNDNNLINVTTVVNPKEI